jgi:cysteinyl-tRNA synthetase
LIASADGASTNALEKAGKFFGESFDAVLGLSLKSNMRSSSSGLIESNLIDLLIDARKEARTNKLWALSDNIRDKLKALGVVIEDTKDGTTWKKV